MNDPTGFARLVPGFEFLQGLVKNAGAALPGIGQWVAPTLDPAELEKRIQELRTVQFWLEQNARMLGTTIQALEVQRMTLTTLKTMNVQMDDLRESLTIRPDAAVAAAAGGPGSAPAPAPAPPDGEPSAARSRRGRKAATPSAAPAVDPVQWWGALTRQFTELASAAVKESTVDAAKGLAAATARRGAQAPDQTLQTTPPRKAARKGASRAAAPQRRAG